METPISPNVAASWRDRWRFIRRLVERIYHVELRPVGPTPAEVPDLEAKLDGRSLSPSVVEWISFSKDLRACSETVVSDYSHYSLRVEDFPEHQSISLNQYYDCARWAVAYQNLEQEDPPVSTYGFVQRRKGFVLRKTYGQVPVTEYALHCVLNRTPWLTGWSSYSWMEAELQDPRGFVDELRNSRNARVSAPFGSVTLVEGAGWLAYVLDGYSPFARQKMVRLNLQEGVQLPDIPRQLRDQVQLQPSHLRPRES